MMAVKVYVSWEELPSLTFEAADNGVVLRCDWQVCQILRWRPEKVMAYGVA